MPVLNGKFYPYRNYTAGEKIRTLDELAKQDYVFCRDQLVQNGWFMSWQFRMADGLVKGGYIRHAIKKEEKDA